MEYVLLKVQVEFAHNLLRCGWLWVWGQTLFTLGLLIFALSLVDFLPLLWNPSTNINIFIFVKCIIWRAHTKSSKIHVGLKFEWSLQDKYWLSWALLSFEVFFSCLCDVLLGVTYANMLMTTQWPLKRAPLLTSLAWVWVVWRYESSLELSALWLLWQLMSCWWRELWHQHGRAPLGLYVLSRRTSYHKIKWGLEAVRFGFRLFQSPWYLTRRIPAWTKKALRITTSCSETSYH